MREADILKLYADAAKQTGFQENSGNPGWMPKLGPDDYRSVLRHGKYQDKLAMLKVSPHENLTKIARYFIRYQQGTEGKPAIRVPAILANGEIAGAQFLIQEEAPEGKRVIGNWPMSSASEKEEIARLYWNTIVNFPAYEAELEEWSVADYFTYRLEKTLAAGRDYGIQTKGFISAQEKNNLVAHIFKNIGVFSIEAFFAHFSNTDIVKADSEYYIWESQIVPKPDVAGIAQWLWAATLYAHSIPPVEWKREFDAWTETFIAAAPSGKQENLKLKININLIERFLSTLLMDLPLKRSPFDKLSDADVAKARELVRELLNDIVPL